MSHPAAETLDSPDECVRIYSEMATKASTKEKARENLNRALELEPENLEANF